MDNVIKGRAVEEELPPGVHASRVALAAAATVVRLALPDDPDASHWGTRARSLRNFNHPSLARVRGGGTWDKNTNEPPFIAYEHVAGPLLSEVADDIDGTTSDEIMRALTAGVLALHDAGMVHGMIHAGQVRLNQDGAPVLLDVAATWNGAQPTEKTDAQALVALALSLPAGNDRDTWQSLRDRALTVGEITAALDGQASAVSLAPPPVADTPPSTPARRTAPRRRTAPPEPASATPALSAPPVAPQDEAPALTLAPPPNAPSSPGSAPSAASAPAAADAASPASVPAPPTPTASTPDAGPTEDTHAADLAAKDAQIAALNDDLAAKTAEAVDLATAKAAADEYATSLEQRIAHLSQAQTDGADLRTQFDTQANELTNATRDLAAARAALETARLEINTANDARDEARRDLSTANAAKAAAEEATAQHIGRIAGLEGQLTALNEQIAELTTAREALVRDATAHESALAGVQGELANAQQENQALTQEIERLNRQATAAASTTLEEQERTRTLEEELRAARSEAVGLRGQVRTLSDRATRGDEAQSALTAAEARIVVLERQAVDSRADAEQARREAVDAREAAAALQSQLDQSQQSLALEMLKTSRLTSDLQSALAAAAPSTATLTQPPAGDTEKVTALTGQVHTLTTQVESLRRDLTAASQRATAAEGEAQALHQQLAAAQAAVARPSGGVSAVEVQGLRTQVEEANQRAEAAAASHQQVLAELSEARQALTQQHALHTPATPVGPSPLGPSLKAALEQVSQLERAGSVR